MNNAVSAGEAGRSFQIGSEIVIMFAEEKYGVALNKAIRPNSAAFVEVDKLEVCSQCVGGDQEMFVVGQGQEGDIFIQSSQLCPFIEGQLNYKGFEVDGEVVVARWVGLLPYRGVDCCSVEGKSCQGLREITVPNGHGSALIDYHIFPSAVVQVAFDEDNRSTVHFNDGIIRRCTQIGTDSDLSQRVSRDDELFVLGVDLVGIVDWGLLALDGVLG